MGTTVKKLYNILENSKTENLSPETLQYVEELKLKVEELKKIEENIVNRAYINGYDDCEVKRNRKMNYFLYTYDMNKLFNL
jgi:predicted GNAT superfamily acetyltransferase